MEKPSNRTVRRIRAVRTRAGLSAEALARRMTSLGIPMTAAKLHNVERGRTALRVDDIWKFAAALGVSPFVLLATHPTDDDIDLEGLQVGTFDALAWEAGADVPTSRDGADAVHAQDAAEAFGLNLLPAGHPSWVQLTEARLAQNVARRLNDKGREAVHASIEEQVEQAAEQWRDSSAVAWLNWLAVRPRGGGSLGDAVMTRLQKLPKKEREAIASDFYDTWRSIALDWLDHAANVAETSGSQAAAGDTDKRK